MGENVTRKILGAHLVLGRLGPWVSAKDVILELLRRRWVQGGVGKVFEFVGSGIQDLTVPDRAVITNMTAELEAGTQPQPTSFRTEAMELLSICTRCGYWQPRDVPLPDRCPRCGAPREYFVRHVEELRLRPLVGNCAQFLVFRRHKVCQSRVPLGGPK